MKHQTYNGKIGRLPEAIRNEVCRKLLDGKTGSEILPWLNGLAEVKALLASKWAGKPISDANLTEWRQGGYQHWLENHADVARTRASAEVANALAKAANGKLSEGAAAIAGGTLFELVDAAAKARRAAEDAFLKNPTDDNAAAKSRTVARFLELLDALNDLRGGDLEAEKVKIKVQDGERADRKLDIDMIKVMRETSAVVQKALKNESLREEFNRTDDNTAQLELIGRELFGDRWKGIEPAS